MKTSLNFVKGVVAKKDYIPALTFFQIKNQRILSGNGQMFLSASLPVDIDVHPLAAPFVAAINNCEGDIGLNMSDTGRLVIKSGRFRAAIPCLAKADDYPKIDTDGEEIAGVSFLEVFKTMVPFIGTDGSRPWCTGLLLTGGKAYATNNALLVKYTLPVDFTSTVVIPASCIAEVLRIKEEPISIVLNKRYIVFKYSGDRWLRSSILASKDWPNAEKALDVRFDYKKISEDFFIALETLEPFLTEERIIYIKNSILQTTKNNEIGAYYELEHFTGGGAYRYEVLALLRNRIIEIDFSPFPGLVGFQGKNIIGVLAGMNI